MLVKFLKNCNFNCAQHVTYCINKINAYLNKQILITHAILNTKKIRRIKKRKSNLFFYCRIFAELSLLFRN